MNWKMLVTIVALAPFLALFIGVGILFHHIGRTWDARTTESLIMGLVATCGGGVVIIGVLLAIIIGVPFAIRLMREAGQAEGAWRALPPYPPSYHALSAPPLRQPLWTQRPPLLEDKQGSWQRAGDVYDAWDDDPNSTTFDGFSQQ